MARKNSISDRAQRLRQLAASAEKIGDKAMAADETLAKMRHDLLTLVSAARALADKLNAEAGQ